MQLRANVLTKPDFQQEARKNFVLLELDYPRRKKQSAEVKAANRKLAEQYGVTSFPTIVFADASGKPFGGGFVGGRPREDVMKAMQDALKNKEALQMVEAEVAKASTDEARAVALMEVFKLAPRDYVDNFYGDVKAEIKEAGQGRQVRSEGCGHPCRPAPEGTEGRAGLPDRQDDGQDSLR